MHIAAMMAVAETLVKSKESWKGTVVVLFQPNEERAGGAK
jgi:metal-dependent amidase/aminoacylase/carboxypeptidase family protein